MCEALPKRKVGINCKVVTENILILTAKQKKMTIFVTPADINGFFDWVACQAIMIFLNLLFT